MEKLLILMLFVGRAEDLSVPPSVRLSASGCYKASQARLSPSLSLSPPLSAVPPPLQ